MKIGELASRSGLSVYTLRYYERIGLLPRADRDAGRRRDYDASILTWIAFLMRLKATGMPIKDMLRYARLRAQGAGTEPARRTLLESHRNKVAADIAALRANLHYIDQKIAGYGDTKFKETLNDRTDAPCRKLRETAVRKRTTRRR